MLNLAGTLSLMLVVMAASTTYCCEPANNPGHFGAPGKRAMEESREDHMQFDRRMVGGHVAPWTSNRYMASLQKNMGGTWCGWIGIQCEWDHFCGGTVIGQKWVLTAAHCLHDKKNESGRISYPLKNKEDIRVVLGARDLKHPEHPDVKPSEHHQNIDVERIIIHQDFDPKAPLFNDIALIELASPFNGIRGHVVKATIAPGKLDHLDNTCITAGWGELTKKKGGTQYLKQVKMQLFDKDTCYRDFRLRVDKITQQCSQSDPALLCEGDSGGPLMCGLRLKGVLSRGNCRAPVAGKPTYVVTKVEPFIQWIKDETELPLP